MKRIGWRVSAVAGCAFVVASLSVLQRPGCWDGRAVAPGHYQCVDDVWSLWRLRDLGGHVFPFAHEGRFGLPQGTVEYPVLTNLWAWISALPVHTATEYLLLSAALLGLVAAVTAGALARDYGRAALLYAASPALAIYAAHNWDVLPVAATVAGVHAWRRGAVRGAAIWFAVGACLKAYPGLFLLPLIAEQRFRGERSQSFRVAALALATIVVSNVAFLTISPHLWAEVWSFQSQRPIDISATSLWSAFGGGVPLVLANAVSTLATILAVCVVLTAASRRAAREASYPGIACAAALGAAFVLVGKVASPQYALWLIPFFVVLDVEVRWWLAFEACDVALWLAVLRHFDGPGFGVLTGSPSQVALVVTARAVVLVALVRRFLGANARPVRSPQIRDARWQLRLSGSPRPVTRLSA